MWPFNKSSEGKNIGVTPAGGGDDSSYEAAQTPSFLRAQIAQSIESGSLLSLEHFRMAVREILSKKCGVDSDVATVLSLGLLSGHVLSDAEKEKVNVTLAPNGQEFDFSVDGIESLIVSLMINHGVPESIINLVREDHGVFGGDGAGKEKKMELLNYMKEIGIE